MNAELKREPITFETEDSEVLAYLARCSSDLDYDRMSETVATEQKDVLLTLLYHGCHTETAPETVASEEPTTETVVFAESETHEKEEVEEYVKKSGGKIIAGKGATFYGIAASVCHIIKYRIWWSSP